MVDLNRANAYEYREMLMKSFDKYTLEELELEERHYKRLFDVYEKEYNECRRETTEESIFFAGFNYITFKNAVEKKKTLIEYRISKTKIKAEGKQGQYKFILD